MFDIELLEGMLPAGAIAQWVENNAVLNIKGHKSAWQVAVTEQLDDPAYAIAQAWRMQAEHEHTLRMVEERKKWHDKIQAMANEHRLDREKKMKDAHDKWSASPKKAAWEKKKNESSAV